MNNAGSPDIVKEISAGESLSASSVGTCGAIVDFSHLGRLVTGLERISMDLFGADTLAALSPRHIRASGIKKMILKQWVGMPLTAFLNRKAKLLFPGFPPGIPVSALFGKRVIPYVHDLFLLTRPQDLNTKAKLYMRPSFRYAVTHLDTFFVNSQKTEDELRNYCKPTAKIIKFRPVIENCFQLECVKRTSPVAEKRPLKIVMLGTLEPRKNYTYAVAIHRALCRLFHPGSELHIIGRHGWGIDLDCLVKEYGVHYHGYQEPDAIRAIVNSCDAFLSTSHDEGLGLPLLEVQYSGIPIFATDIQVFKEVLGDSGNMVDRTDATAAAADILRFFESGFNADKIRDGALDNIQRWNRAALDDRRNVLQFLAGSV